MPRHTHFRKIRFKLIRKIVFEERFSMLRKVYLWLLAFKALPFSGALTYIALSLQQIFSLKRAQRIAVGRNIKIDLRADGTDLAVFEQIMLLGDINTSAIGEPVQFIIDAGAHIGCSSIFYALKYPTAQIFAIEPEPGNFEQLCINVRQIPRICPIRAAVYHQGGEVVILNPSESPWGYQFGTLSAGQSIDSPLVSSLTMHDVIIRSGFPYVDILKLDIEGAEKDVFDEESYKWLRFVREMVVELHDRLTPGCTERFERAVARMPHKILETLNNTVWINLSFGSVSQAEAASLDAL